MPNSHQRNPQRRKYFVLHLKEPRSEQVEEGIFEIQILDAKGRAEQVGYIGYQERFLNIAGHNIPKAVLEAARRQPKGQGDYVDSEGNSISPF